MSSYQYQRINQSPSFEPNPFIVGTTEHQPPEPPKRDYHAAYGQLRRDLLEYADRLEGDLPDTLRETIDHLRYLAGSEDDDNG